MFKKSVKRKADEYEIDEEETLISFLTHGGYSYESSRSLKFLKEFPILIEKHGLCLYFCGGSKCNLNGGQFSYLVTGNTQFFLKFLDTGKIIDVSVYDDVPGPQSTGAWIFATSNLTVCFDARGDVCGDVSINNCWKNIIPRLIDMELEYEKRNSRSRNMSFVKQSLRNPTRNQ